MRRKPAKASAGIRHRALTDEEIRAMELTEQRYSAQPDVEPSSEEVEELLKFLENREKGL